MTEDSIFDNPNCPRCGKDFNAYLEEHHSMHTLIVDGQQICSECFTDEEEEQSFRTAHFLVTGHYPDTEECTCLFDDNSEDSE